MKFGGGTFGSSVFAGIGARRGIPGCTSGDTVAGAAADGYDAAGTAAAGTDMAAAAGAAYDVNAGCAPEEVGS